MRVILSVLVFLTMLNGARAQNNFPPVDERLVRLFERLFALPNNFSSGAIHITPQWLQRKASESLQIVDNEINEATQLQIGLALLPPGSPAIRVIREEFQTSLAKLRTWKKQRVLAKLREIFAELRQSPYAVRHMQECEETSRRLDEALRLHRGPPRVSATGKMPESHRTLRDIPENVAIFKSLSALKLAGFVSEHPHDAHLMSRYSVAEIRELLRQGMVLAEQLTPATIGPAVIHLPGNFLSRTALMLLVVGRELSADANFVRLGEAYIAQAKRVAWMVVPRPSEVLSAFSDVSSGHWAASCVAELRKARILVGYGDNRIRR